MIENEQQYYITEDWLARFEQARAAVPEQSPDEHPLLLRAFRDQYDSQIEELSAQIAEYEALCAGRIRIVSLPDLDSVPDALIGARRDLGLTRQELAERMGITARQVQRYEQTRYQSASLARLLAVCAALGVSFQLRATLPQRPTAAAPARPSPHKAAG